MHDYLIFLVFLVIKEWLLNYFKRFCGIAKTRFQKINIKIWVIMFQLQVSFI